MNTENNPCESDINYSYFSCIMQKVMRRANCKPFWMTMISSALPQCSSYSMLRNFYNMSNELRMMDEKTLFDTYQCLKPCSFMEYKVDFSKIVHRAQYFICFFIYDRLQFDHSRPSQPK